MSLGTINGIAIEDTGAVLCPVDGTVDVGSLPHVRFRFDAADQADRHELIGDVLVISRGVRSSYEEVTESISVEISPGVTLVIHFVTRAVSAELALLIYTIVKR